MSFEEAYEEFKIYASKRHKKQGFVTILQDFSKHILPYFKNKKVNELTKIDIINWQNEILNYNFSNNFNAKLYYVFNSFIKYCLYCSYIQENIVASVGSFSRKIEIKSHTTYNIHQFRKFRFYLSNFILKEYFNFMYFYGTRPSEAMALRFLDLKFNYVFIRHSIERKGNRSLDTPKNQSSIRIIKIDLLMIFRI